MEEQNNVEESMTLNMSSTTMINIQESKKRAIEEELQPVLIRITANSPNSCYNCIYINKNKFKIGRRPDNDKVILNVLISRNHCVLQYDINTGNWLVTNLSSTDTLLNEKPIEHSKTEIIKEGDVLQLSLSDIFRYIFTLKKKNLDFAKIPKLESGDNELNKILINQRLFVQYQENQRKHLETQVSDKQEEQERLKHELDKLLQDQKITKTHNEELNNQIIELQNKIYQENSMELQLQEKYRELLRKLEEEKQKWQEALQETKREKEKLEMSMVEKMEEWREELEKRQQEEWKKKIENILHKEKNIQIKLQNEKQLLEQKIVEMENTLKDKERVKKRNDIKNCIVIDVKDLNNVQENPSNIIDLTEETDNSYLNIENDQNEAVLHKVNNIMDEQLTCSICSELFIRAMTLNCTHTFCRYCIDSWVMRRNECPNCRTTIISMTPSLVLDNFIEKMLESLTPEEMQKRKQLINDRLQSSKVHGRKRVLKKR